MREILFRGKRIDNGEWIVGSLLIDPDTKSYSIYGFDYYSTAEGLQREPFCTIVDPSTVGQYTGLPDLHNNPIFEGDIVKGVCYAGKTEGIVTFKDGYYYIHAYAGYCEQLSRCSHMVEVIGNIHDNPELLEDKP